MGLLNKFRKNNCKLGHQEEIMNSLASLLNTKEGFGAWQKGLGLNNYSYVNSYTGAIKEILNDIECNILNFDKRIQIIDIEFVDTDVPLTLKFQIKCEIAGKFHSFYIGFSKNMDSTWVKEEENGLD